MNIFCVTGRVAGLLMFVWLTAIAQAQNAAFVDSNYTPQCDAPDCIPLFESNRIRINEITSIAEFSIFENPLLEISFELVNTPANESLPLRVYVPPARLTDASVPPAHCQLHVVGFAREGVYQPFVEVRSFDPVRERLFAFCERYNLPGTNTDPLPFPTGSLFHDEAGVTVQVLEAGSEAYRITRVMERAIAGTCVSQPETMPATSGASAATPRPPRPLTLQSLSTQFAVFILFSDNPDTIWQAFQLESENIVYSRDREAIYCLLDGTGINPPPPTPTPTLTPTPIMVFTPTPTVMPLIERELIPVPVLGSPVSFLQLIGLITGVLGFGLVMLVLFTSARIWRAFGRVLLIGLFMFGIGLFIWWVLRETGLI